MKRAALLFLFLVFVAAGAIGAWFYIGVNRPYKGYTAGDEFVEIPPGSGSSAIARRLVDSGVVRDVNSFRLALWLNGKARHLQAGEYHFDHPVSAREVADKIARGEVYVIPITFPEGLTMQQMADEYAAKQFGSSADFLTAAQNASLVHAMDPGARNLEGYLFPDTYNLPRKVSSAQLVSRMVTDFEKAVTPELLDQIAARGLTIHQWVTLASIVEKETGNPAERPIVAAVYLNRLKRGMALQCDPTVIYALQRAGDYDGTLTRAGLHFDSPYNTYRYPGLPPGPIASPGRASLAAAANPADVPYLYFVAKGDGTHAFAVTLEEHNRNVAIYQLHKKIQ